MSADASDYDLQNVECQSLLPSCKIPSRSQREQLRTIVFSNQRSYVVWLTGAWQCFQLARVANFPLRSHSTVASQWTGIQHSQCMRNCACLQSSGPQSPARELSYERLVL